MAYLAQQALNALQLGSVYALIALGYSLVYGVLLMINFAHGDIFMVAAFVCFLLVAKLGLTFLPTLFFTMLVAAVLGVSIERVAYRPLRQAPRVSAIITALGVGIFLESFTLALSPYPKHIPSVINNQSWNFFGVTLSTLQAITISLSLLLMGILHYIVKYTMVGIAMRAISWDRTVVPLMGVPVNKVISITFALGSGLAGAAGVMYALSYPVVDAYMGVAIGWKAFISAVLGGIGSIAGAVIGGFLLGAIEILIAAFLPSTYRDLIVFLILFLFLIFRPHGIIGRPQINKV